MVSIDPQTIVITLIIHSTINMVFVKLFPYNVLGGRGVDEQFETTS